MPSDFFKNIKNAATSIIPKTGITLSDDRGNPLNIPINRQHPTGIYRTYLPGNKVSSVMTKPNASNAQDYPLGFTPESYYYVSGTQSVNSETGYPVEKGNIQSGARLVNNTSLNKISRTNLIWSPASANPTDGQIGNNSISYLSDLPTGMFGTAGNNNVYGSSKITAGFTNPFLYIMNAKAGKNPVTNLPWEFGSYPNDVKPNFNKNSAFTIDTTPETMLKGNGSSIVGAEEVFNLFNNAQQYSFVHNLDQSIPTSGLSDPSSFKEVHLASYVSNLDNEDPTMFGYDISINFATSPLFNGSVIQFINQFTSTPEIESRRDIWLTFCKQFFKFFKLDHPSAIAQYNSQKFNSDWQGDTPTTSSSNNDLKKQTGDYTQNRFGKNYNSIGSTLPETTVTSNKKSGNKTIAKTYYLKKISGLENLVERDVSVTSDTIKSMVDYGKDTIKLSLYEDVSTNTGYLAMLYKTLSWSRRNGKQLIPENLLRFDAKITITEIRDYNRVIKDYNSDDLDVFPDNLTKYTYTLYDCQFMFNEMSHGNEIDMSSPKMVDSFDISFNYKYSTLSFDKFVFSKGATNSNSTKMSINNRNPNVLQVDPNSATGMSSSLSGGISQTYTPVSLRQYRQYTKNKIQTTQSNGQIPDMQKEHNRKVAEAAKTKWEDFTKSQGNPLKTARTNDLGKTMLKDLGHKLKRAAIDEVNRQITTQARLLNNTLDNIRNSIGIGKMSEPTNVYDNVELKNDTKNAFKEFIGKSVRGFFDGNI